MAKWRKNPVLYQINTWTWLHGLRDKLGEPITLAGVPDTELDALAAWQFDAVWLMGVWERSPVGRTIALEHPDLQAEYHDALPDFQPEDVVGSPYAVRRYVVDATFGGDAALALLRERLAERGLGLVLDYVPNHTAVDHPWLDTHPTAYIQGTHTEFESQPGAFFAGPHGDIFAHGRDPYFPPWTDTAQLNAFSPVLRAKTAETLLYIAARCDAVRCDMAMLLTDNIFSQTWGERAGDPPPVEFWNEITTAIKTQYPDFRFMAEVYWDMEWELQQQGFDFTYDKRLYDRMVKEPSRAIVAHLQAELDYQEHMVRFIENHDEPRATTAFGPGRDLAAAVLVATLPGATLLHEGQMVGCHVQLPVQLGRRPSEPENEAVLLFYQMLLAEIAHPVYHEGDWRLCNARPAWDLNASHRSLVVYTWHHDAYRRLVVVNWSHAAAQGRIMLAHLDLGDQQWRLHDRLHPMQVYERGGVEMAEDGLYVDLPAWQAHVFDFQL